MTNDKEQELSMCEACGATKQGEPTIKLIQEVCASCPKCLAFCTDCLQEMVDDDITGENWGSAEYCHACWLLIVEQGTQQRNQSVELTKMTRRRILLKERSSRE